MVLVVEVVVAALVVEVVVEVVIVVAGSIIISISISSQCIVWSIMIESNRYNISNSQNIAPCRMNCSITLPPSQKYDCSQ